MGFKAQMSAIYVLFMEFMHKNYSLYVDRQPYSYDWENWKSGKLEPLTVTRSWSRCSKPLGREPEAASTAGASIPGIEAFPVLDASSSGPRTGDH